MMTFYDAMEERYDACVKGWLRGAPYANPGILQMYFRRNQSRPAPVPWYGEFSGKYLTSAALAYAMDPDTEIRQAGDYVVEQLAAAQDADGYLGVWPDDQKLRGVTPNGDKTWDAWSHYHNMLGLRYWRRVTGSEAAGRVLEKAADCLYNFYVVQNHPIERMYRG